MYINSKYRSIIPICEVLITLDLKSKSIKMREIKDSVKQNDTNNNFFDYNADLVIR